MAVMQTRLTRLLGIRYPVMQGGMQHVGTAPLAAAVSAAGGLGTITALSFDGAAALAAEIALCRSMTSAPFAVNLSVFPARNPPDYPALISAIADAGVTVVETAGTALVRGVWEQLLARGITVIHKCTSVRHALSAQRRGVQVVSIDGFECAGHPGEDDIGAMVLVPRAVEALRVPVIASGGMADGRGLVAALALGAEGVNMGTRFCATVEAPIHPAVKQAYVAHDERDTDVLLRCFGNSARVARNAVSAQVLARTAEAGASFADVADLMSGERGRALLQSGQIDSGIYWAGQSQGLIHDIPTCAQLMERIIEQARAICQHRLAGMMAG
jgi:NAD(P)H-dependent flavin oxidoreductase YrpB (nitropropane dioxygenase family)